MQLEAEVIGKVLLSLLLGALVGAEREFYRKPAGVRTHALICLGATLFTILSITIDATRGDPARIAAQIIPGVGFLGAGAILRDQGRIVGLTTAAGIWVVAAIGMAVGGGYYAMGAGATVLTLLVLRVLDLLEGWIERVSEARTYRIRVADAAGLDVVQRLLEESGLRAERAKRMLLEGSAVGTWTTIGRHELQDRFVERLFGEPGVVEFSW